MARQSKCPACGNTGFEIAENSPRGSNYKLYFIQCDSCGTVVGTQEYCSTSALILKLAEKLKIKL